MAFFTRTDGGLKSYYVAETSGSVGASALLLGEHASSDKDSLSLEEALTDASLKGIFIFSPLSLEIEGKAAQAGFAEKIWTAVARKASSRGIIWVPDAADLTDADQLPYVGLSGNGGQLSSGLSDAVIVLGLSLSVDNGMDVTLSGTDLVLTRGEVGFSGSDAPTMRAAREGTIAFAGDRRGCLTFSPYIERRSLGDDWNWGFHFVVDEAASITGLASEWLPLADTQNGSDDMIGFVASFDPGNPLNSVQPVGGNAQTRFRSGLVFTGSNLDSARTALASAYRTVNGDPVTLYPIGKDAAQAGQEAAGFIFSVGERVSDSVEDFHAGPFGDFVIDTEPGQNGTTAELLCGMSGAEFVSVLPGSDAAKAARMRFVPYKPAYSAVFPPAVASPTGPPAKGDALLEPDYTTSWVTIMPPSAANPAVYAAQPDGSALFGYDPYVWARENRVLGHVDPGVSLPGDGSVVFPMVPYSGFTPGSTDAGFSQQKSRDFETLIVGPTRRARIGTQQGQHVLSARAQAAGEGAFEGLAASHADAGKTRFTTPSGLIATIDTASGSADWAEVLLGQVTTPVTSRMLFDQPTPELQQAFQTNQLFMVAANDLSFVKAGGSFENRLNIGGWTLAANVGQSPDYGDYANVMIIKGLPGKLYDPKLPKDENLIANPSKWTQADTFAAPTTADTARPDRAQLVNLSQWLQDYFEDALNQPDQEYFRTFNDIAQDENWTGILVLRAKIASPPSDLAGITAGVRDADRYYAHHFAIKISQIKSDPKGGGICIDKQSSVYGLIYYQDSAYDPQRPEAPVVPKPGEDYDFITLTLKVLFENTSVKSFSSFTQLTANTLFGSTVTDMGAGGNPYNSVIMAGTFQDNNTKPTYGMKMIGDYVFNISNNVLKEVETVSAEMVTVSVGQDTTQVRFVLNGYLGYHILQTIDGTPVDYFSFGNEAGESKRKTGLNYSALGLNMSFKTPDPDAPPQVVQDRVIVFDSSQIAFNTQASHAREESLYKALSLELQGLVSGPSDGESPQALGYLDVVTQARMGNLGKTWNALKFRLNLGTAGELAGKLGLNAYLLLSWAPGSTAGPDVNGVTAYKAATSLHMPGTNNGAPLISLQNVLSMSYGTIQLLYENREVASPLHPATLRPVTPVARPAGTTPKQYMLLLNEIAIKFMGLLKLPPSGSTSFYLFGAADPQDQQNTGLAWYAAYNNEPKSAATTVTESDRRAGK
jgi:hypothetical protein